MPAESFERWNIDPSLLNENIAGRFEMLRNMLNEKVGDVNPRLSDPELRTTVGDWHTAELTYGEIVDREVTQESPCLPAGAVHCTDPAVLLTTMEHHIASINHYLCAGYSQLMDDQLAGYQVKEFQESYSDCRFPHGDWADWLHPKVEGYDWFRGYKVDVTEKDSVLILRPWMQPWVQGGSPFPEIFLLGEPDPQEVQKIVFAMGIS